MFTKQVIKGDVYIVSLIEELVIVTMSLEHLATINYFIHMKNITEWNCNHN